MVAWTMVMICPPLNNFALQPQHNRSAKMASLPSHIMPVTKIIYRFRDASVPPQYHRSYRISVTATKANVVVDSYGKRLNESTVELTPPEFQAVLDVLEKSQITQETETEATPRAIGGKLEYLQLFDHDLEILNANTSSSGGQGAGKLCGDTKAVRQCLRNLFPNFKSLLK